ncbi:hypothetical protein WA158_002423 [Blastocystis sp. Blastoise]
MSLLNSVEIRLLYKQILRAANREPRTITKQFIKREASKAFHRNINLTNNSIINSKIESGIACLHLLNIAQETGQGGERKLMINMAYILQQRINLSKTDPKFGLKYLIDKQYNKLDDVTKKVIPLREIAETYKKID